MSDSSTIPIETSDATNERILAVSEDRIQGFVPDPIEEISRLSGVEVDVVIERIQAMLRAGTIRRVRQTLLATNLARGALVAWRVPEEKLAGAFDYMARRSDRSIGKLVSHLGTEGLAERVGILSNDRQARRTPAP